MALDCRSVTRAWLLTAFGSSCVAAIGCAANAVDHDVRPPGWENADPVELSQGECQSTLRDDDDESIHVDTATYLLGDDGIELTADLLFNCAVTDVCSYVQVDDDRAEVLFQPCQPRLEQAKCNCVFHLEAGPIEPPLSQIDVYIRGIDLPDRPSEPELVVSLSVE